MFLVACLVLFLSRMVSRELYVVHSDTGRDTERQQNYSHSFSFFRQKEFEGKYCKDTSLTKTSSHLKKWRPVTQRNSLTLKGIQGKSLTRTKKIILQKTILI